MTKEESAIIAKLVTAPWNREYTPELGIAFHAALQDHQYRDALGAAGTLLKQPDRRFAPSPGEIVGQISKGTVADRHFYKASPGALASYEKQMTERGMEKVFTVDPETGRELGYSWRLI